MLKVHPEFKIYGIDYANTIKSLVAEGFIEDYLIPELNFSSLYLASPTGDDLIYEVDTKSGVQKLPFSTVYTMYQKQAPNFLVTVCSKTGKKLVPNGFIYL